MQFENGDVIKNLFDYGAQSTYVAAWAKGNSMRFTYRERFC